MRVDLLTLPELDRQSLRWWLVDEGVEWLCPFQDLRRAAREAVQPTPDNDWREGYLEVAWGN